MSPIERLGGLDVLINNAGLGIPQSAGRAPDERAISVLEVNPIGPWRVTGAALPALRESRGRVVNVASGLAHLAVPFATATGIHAAATERGVGLEGAVPAERVEDAARALARAALGRPVRDLATTRAGTIQYFLARRSPRRLLDLLTTIRMRRLARRGAFEPNGLAGEPAARLR